jgi:hypothetical protein
MSRAILASQWHGGETSLCHCEAGIASLALPGVKNMSQSTKIAVDDGTISVIVTKRVIGEEGRHHPRQQDSQPLTFPRPIPTRPLSNFVLAGLARRASSIARCPRNINNFTSTVHNRSVDRSSPFLLSHRPTNRRALPDDVSGLLYDCARQGEVNDIRFILDVWSRRRLHLACTNDHAGLVRLILSRGTTNVASNGSGNPGPTSLR